MAHQIVIITEGGKDIGFGHISRCFSLYRVLTNKGEAPRFLVNDDPSALSYLSNLGALRINTRSKPETLEDLPSLEGDIAIVDSYRLPLSAYEEIAQRFRLLVSIDDENRLPYPKGIIVNGALYAETLPYPKKTDALYLLGPSYFMLRPEYESVPEHTIREEVQDILITVGGADPHRLTERLIPIAGHTTEATLHVLTTDGFEDLETIHRIAETVKGNIHFYHNHHKISDIVIQCDVALSAGGQTTYELAMCGIPTIGICTATNQLLNLQAWEERGFLLFAGWENDPTLKKNIENSLLALSSKERRKRMSKAGKKTIDGRGAVRVVEKIFSYFSSSA